MDIAAVYHRPDSEMAYLGANGVFEIRLKVKHDDVLKLNCYMVIHMEPKSMKKMLELGSMRPLRWIGPLSLRHTIIF